MRLEQLRYLCDIQHTHSISKTAKRFFVSQQSLSNNIKQLETELNVPLLERSAIGVMLTPQAEKLIALSDAFIEQYDQLVEQFTTQQNTLEDMPRIIKIYTSSIVSSILLPNIISLFSRQYPNIRIAVEEVAYQDIFPAIIHSHCHLALFTINETYFLDQLKVYNDSMFKYHIILTDRMVGCVSSKSSLAKKDIIDQADMTTRFFTYLNIVPLQGRTPRPKGTPLYTANNIDFHRKILREMDVITLMPNYAYINLFDNKYYTSKPLEDGQQVVYHTILHSDSQPHPVIQELVNMIISSI